MNAAFAPRRLVIRYEVNERRMFASPLDVNAHLSKRLNRKFFLAIRAYTSPLEYQSPRIYNTTSSSWFMITSVLCQ